MSTSHEQSVSRLLNEAFPDLTAKELAAIVSFAKLVRFRARSNTALDSMLHRMFPEFACHHMPYVTNMGNKGTMLVINDVTIEEGV